MSHRMCWPSSFPIRPRLLRHYHPLSTTAAPPTGATNTAAATATTTTPPPGTNPPPPAYQPGFISRHAGKLFVALVGSLVTYFYSISKVREMYRVQVGVTMIITLSTH